MIQVLQEGFQKLPHGFAAVVGAGEGSSVSWLPLDRWVQHLESGLIVAAIDGFVASPKSLNICLRHRPPSIPEVRGWLGHAGSRARVAVRSLAAASASRALEERARDKILSCISVRSESATDRASRDALDDVCGEDPPWEDVEDRPLASTSGEGA